MWNLNTKQNKLTENRPVTARAGVGGIEGEGGETGEGSQKVKTFNYKISKSRHMMYSMMAIVINTILHI